jgi:hypothetical protein
MPPNLYFPCWAVEGIGVMMKMIDVDSWMYGGAGDQEMRLNILYHF